jgi:hypothetical protein
MSIAEFQEILIDTITTTTGQDLPKNATISELMGLEDIERDDDILWVLMEDGSEFELKIKKTSIE